MEQHLRQSLVVAEKRNYHKYDKWFGADPEDYLQSRIACSLPLQDFEESEQTKILEHFLQFYDEDPDFLAADLPSLAKFVTLDHLPLFQYLTRDGQRRNGATTPHLDLGIPLFGSVANLSYLDAGESICEPDSDNIGRDNDCSICLDPIDEPVMLKCGHSFHRKCLFSYVFPRLRGDGDDDVDQLMHTVLSSYPHLSFTVGRTNCPNCRQSIKPSLPEAFALNLADGIRRTLSEKRACPRSPQVDLLRCRAGMTVGEALLAFAACTGALGIFQWLVDDCHINPDLVEAGGVNIMQHAVAHQQPLIIRWLFQRGYSSMIYGGLDTDELTSFDPVLSSPDFVKDIMVIDLDKKVNANRIRFWKPILERYGSIADFINHVNFELDDFEIQLLKGVPAKPKKIYAGFGRKRSFAVPSTMF